MSIVDAIWGHTSIGNVNSADDLLSDIANYTSMDSPGQGRLSNMDEPHTTYPDPTRGVFDQHANADSYIPRASCLSDLTAIAEDTIRVATQDVGDEDDDLPSAHEGTQYLGARRTRRDTRRGLGLRQKEASEPGDRPAPSVQRQTRRGKNDLSAKSPAEANDDATNRLERSLERNRVAASKCRKRRKIWTEKLEEKKSDLEEIHKELQAQYMSLLQETSQLKNHLIGHACCHDPNIDVWINNEASRYARRLNTQVPHHHASGQDMSVLDHDLLWQSSSSSHVTDPPDGSLDTRHDASNQEAGEYELDDEAGDEMFQVPND
ncbi:activating transcription factor 7a [Moelleriella libera RCEF 2490]|uniref:Activating transcription factor 7a n=1 Tax=Moelleriella libera RCEF 2490 TaxID=1081109 RepID=A0A162IG08_9HYPO|nr:activating transcription factor 7a [Moelleriella libera RCEF 2490]